MTDETADLVARREARLREAEAQRDIAMHQRDELIHERNALMRERDGAMIQRDDAMVQRDEQMRLVAGLSARAQAANEAVRGLTDTIQRQVGVSSAGGDFFGRGPYILPGHLAEELGDPTPHLGNGVRGVLLTTFPKSGSTFLERAINGLSHYRFAAPRFDIGSNGLRFEDIASEMLVGSWTMKVHCLPTSTVVGVLSYFRIATIILIRSLPDALLSLAEDEQFSKSQHLMLPFGLIDNGFAAKDPDEKLAQAVEVFAGWYIAFYFGWLKALRDHPEILTLARYEDLFGSEAIGTMARLMEHIGIQRARQQIEDGLANVGAGPHTRFNRGIAGRGIEALSGCQVDRLRRMVGHYGGDPLGYLGLSASP